MDFLGKLALQAPKSKAVDFITRRERPLAGLKSTMVKMRLRVGYIDGLWDQVPLFLRALWYFPQR